MDPMVKSREALLRGSKIEVSKFLKNVIPAEAGIQETPLVKFFHIL